MNNIFTMIGGYVFPGGAVAKSLVVALITWAASTNQSRAFSLLGPFADWMDVQKDYRQPGDIGGPMNNNEGYRWNIPVVTYGFDRSFLDYFGSNGVAAVEQAIEVFNQLPSASQVNVQKYPAGGVFRENFLAEQLSLIDLKTATLALLLEQMGLSDAFRYSFCIRDFVLNDGTNATVFVMERNFDPTTAQPSAFINQARLSYDIVRLAETPGPTSVFCETRPFFIEPDQALLKKPLTCWADGPGYGLYATGLSQDDVGGLAYLLGGDHVRCESLLSDVRLTDPASGPLVKVADRPGIGKIRFVPHPVGILNREFLPFTNRWTDVFLDFDFPESQEVERIMSRPDIVFSARDLGVITVSRTGTTQWANNADLNGNASGAGPGVIRPPIEIVFSTSGQLQVHTITNQGMSNEDLAVIGYRWASFDNGTNQPIVYPAVQTSSGALVLRLNVSLNTSVRTFQWRLFALPFGRFQLQSSDNLKDWSSLCTFTNSGQNVDYALPETTNGNTRFFRTVPIQ